MARNDVERVESEGGVITPRQAAIGYAGGRNTVSRVEARNTTRRERERVAAIEAALREARRPRLEARSEGKAALRRVSLPEWAVSKLPTGASRDLARMVLHGFARTGNTILKAIDIPNRVFGNTRSLLQDIYEKSEANLERDAYEDRSGVPQVGETAVHLASAGVLGKALPAVFGANVGADTYEMAKYAGASEGEALAKGVGHGGVDMAIWTLGQGLASKYLPKAWQWLGREIIGVGRGAASSVTSDAVLSSLGADISGEEMAKRAVHAAWMVPLLGMLKMGGKRREEAMSLLRKARPELAGAKADKVIETIEAEFSDPKSQKVALAWVARKGANLPDDTAQIRQALEVSSKVKGLDPMSKSPFEILSDPAYARYLPKPKPQDVKAFSNMKRYPMGVIGFDVSDDAAGRQATREMINAYMSPSSNPWCLATGSGATKLGGLGPGAESYWKQHSAVPKQIFFQEVDGKLELTAFRATSPGGEGRQEYWDTSDAGYSGIPLKVKVPGDPMGRYRKMVFRPAGSAETQKIEIADPTDGHTLRLTPGELETEIAQWEGYVNNLETQPGFQTDRYEQRNAADFRAWITEARAKLPQQRQRTDATDEVQGTFEDIAPGKIFKGDPFRDGRSQTWVKQPPKSVGLTVGSEEEIDQAIQEGIVPEHDRERLLEEYRQRDTGILSLTATDPNTPYVLVEDKVRTTESGVTKFRTTKYADPTNGDYEPPKPGEALKPVEIEESELVSPEWMRVRGYDPESESDVRRMQQELGIQAWGNGMEAAMAVVPTKRTYMQTKSGTPETVTYGPDGRNIVSVDFEENGVPYRQEYFRSGPKGVDASTIYHTIDPDDFPMPTRSYGRNTLTPSGFRLVREPEGEFPTVLNEVKWDDGLGGFVRTSGNRRWRVISGDPIPPDLERYVAIYREGAEADSRGIDTAPYEHELATEAEGLRLSGIQIPESLSRFLTPRVIAEDRQPDGTWALVETSNIQASPSRANALPPPPDEIPMWAQMGLDEEGLRAELEHEEAMERAYEESMERAAPDMQAQQGLDMDDVPFALKAGRTRRNVRAAEGGGDTPGAPGASVPEGSAPAQPGGPRIVINPKVFEDKRDALCVAFNEAFRLVMEENGFDPVSEPTEAQRKFFADTAYANDELQLRRTILARIATLDTSVKDPTDEQLEETAEMLEMVMEVGAPQNEWEQQAVQRLHDVVVKARGSSGSGAPVARVSEI